MSDSKDSNATLDAQRWARLNPWLTEGQRDDRPPMNGSGGVSEGSPSERRSIARRNHQVKFKEWSKTRHD